MDPQPNQVPAAQILNQAVEALLVETLEMFFTLRAAGKRIGAVTQSGGGYWGMLRLLKTTGPRTVPQLARMRSVTRQRMQTLANELAQDGVIEFVANPDHQRSKLVQLTAHGEAVFQELSTTISTEISRLSHDLEVTEVETAIQVLQHLRQCLQPSLKSQRNTHDAGT
ncbi:MAG TPA: MarR family transcriptional regulator [Acidobacteriota bacterium]|nr:MarR family transcriptional regulator [Acidobacteriota bacterium]HMZ80047.1 MarR family transcriptional regulator [Acidobacteriota bacterium]HNB72726.1 MarR family transcriptional regulator [Acidobacteriota bacterium]HNC44883.1 MarR family transcriptional regulator [Acidobacteriota bacterium]HNJ38885.1 MarR family transcriptional regulator [Acidobacteriota bacterium]